MGILVLFAYTLINLLYSIYSIKNIPILDVTCIALGFVLRVYYGSIITAIPISEWLYLVIITASFYLGFGKRRNELAQNGSSARTVLNFYTERFLNNAMNTCITLTITFYALWCMNKSYKFLYTVPILLILLFRYSMRIEVNSDGDPVNVILGDKFIIIIFLMYVTVMTTLIYYQGGSL